MSKSKGNRARVSMTSGESFDNGDRVLSYIENKDLSKIFNLSQYLNCICIYMFKYESQNHKLTQILKVKAKFLKQNTFKNTHNSRTISKALRCKVNNNVKKYRFKKQLLLMHVVNNCKSKCNDLYQIQISLSLI